MMHTLLPRLLFAATTFLAAALVFLVQPMVAKELLPTFGGTPNVWNTAVVSFQVLLLIGYAFAHVSLHLLGTRRQPLAQLALAAVALAFVPFTLRTGSDIAQQWPPAAAVALLLVIGVGLPYLAVASASPVLQRWYAELGAADSDNPYFLYTASNAGSLVGLLAFPFWLEPALTTTGQVRTWAVVFVAWIVCLAACVLLVRRRTPALASMDAAPSASLPAALAAEPERVRTWRAVRWVLVAAVPSAAMLGVTTFLTTDVASAPLLWVVPLALYLISFMVTFGRRVRVPARVAGVLAAAAVALLMLVELELLDAAPLQRSLLHLAAMFTTAVLAHAWLYEDRPPVRQLTTFYLLLSVGGALGGAFTALLAPLAFDRVLEYPLLLAAALVVRPAVWAGPRRWLASGWGRGLLAIIELAVLGVTIGWLGQFAIGDAGVWGGGTTTALVGIVALLVVLVLRRWGLVIAAAAVFAMLAVATDDEVLHAERNFFGALRVEQTNGTRQLLHGTTLHGSQILDPARRREATTYYGELGPVGDVFDRLQTTDEPFVEVGAVGLGTGTLLAHARMWQRFTFYEIDPAVIRVAQDPDYFTFVSGSDASVEIVEGDARLELAGERDGRFDLLVLDAYSSDAVPVHLLTTEAFELYARKLAPGGVMVLHISSRHLDLEPVVSANAARLGLAALGRDHSLEGYEQGAEYLYSSHWLALARDEQGLAPLEAIGWSPLVAATPDDAWTDDFSNVARTIDWLPGWLR